MAPAGRRAGRARWRLGGHRVRSVRTPPDHERVDDRPGRGPDDRRRRDQGADAALLDLAGELRGRVPTAAVRGFHRAGWSKADVRRFVYEHASRPPVRLGSGGQGGGRVDANRHREYRRAAHPPTTCWWWPQAARRAASPPSSRRGSAPSRPPSPSPSARASTAERAESPMITVLRPDHDQAASPLSSPAGRGDAPRPPWGSSPTARPTPAVLRPPRGAAAPGRHGGRGRAPHQGELLGAGRTRADRRGAAGRGCSPASAIEAAARRAVCTTP